MLCSHMFSVERAQLTDTQIQDSKDFLQCSFTQLKI